MATQETGRDDVEVVGVERSIRLDAPIERVWRSVSRLDELADWLGVEVDDGDRELAVGMAARTVESDGSVRHLLVTEVDEARRVAWHWWREDGDLSAVEITFEPAGSSLDPAGPSTVVRVVETVALASTSAAGRAGVEVAARLDDEWGAALPAWADRLARKLGVATRP